MALGAPAPLLFCTLPGATGGPGRERLFQTRRLEGCLLSLRPGIPPSGRLRRQASIHVAERGWQGERTGALASPVNLGTHWAWLSPGAGQGSARWLSGRNMKLQKSEVAGCKGQGDKETETGRENQSAPTGVGREQPKREGSPQLCLFSHVPSNILEGSLQPHLWYPPNLCLILASSAWSRASSLGTWEDPECPWLSGSVP